MRRPTREETEPLFAPVAKTVGVPVWEIAKLPAREFREYLDLAMDYWMAEAMAHIVAEATADIILDREFALADRYGLGDWDLDDAAAAGAISAAELTAARTVTTEDIDLALALQLGAVSDVD